MSVTREDIPVSSAWSDVPFSPRRLPFFYGWVMVAGSVIAIWASIPGQTMGVGVFKERLLDAWGITSFQLSMAYLFGTLMSGALLSYAGSFIDRYGTRVGMVVSCMGLGASLVLLATADRFSSVEGAAHVVAAIIVTTVCFMAVRFFGQGCLALVSRVLIGKWFERRRGLATGIAAPLSSFGFLSSPLVLNGLSEQLGWREGLLALALFIGGGLALVGLVFFRDNPESCGLHVDGRAAPSAEVDTRPAEFRIAHQFTRAEAAKTLSFWVFSLSMAAHGMFMTAVTFHIESIGLEAGLEPQAAFALFMPMAIFSIPTTMIAGVLSDRFKLKYLLWAYLVTEFTGISALMHIDEAWGRGLLYLGFGITGGLFGTLVTVTWPRFFGRDHLGAVSGLNMSVMVFASALGPVVFAGMEALTGGYQEVMMISSAIPLLLLLFAFRAENPQLVRHKQAEDGE